MLEALLYPLILGLGRVESTEPLRHNGVFQYLAGLPGYPEATTLRRFLLRFAQKGREKLMAVHHGWQREMLGRPQAPVRAILDLDGTVLTVYGKQAGSAIGYNPKKRGRPSYLPLLCFEGISGDILGGSYHPGNTRGHTFAVPLLRECLDRLPASVTAVAVRADSEFYNRRFIEFIEGNGAKYVIVAPLQHGLKSRLGGLSYRRVSKGVFVAEFTYTPHGWGCPRRYVVIRRPVPEEPSAQLHLFQMQGFTYQTLVTNMSLQPLNLWRFYNRRATAELVIRELKDAYALGKIPTRDLAANESFFQIVLLAYNLLNWFKRLAAPPGWQHMTLQRLRQRLLLVPAQLVHPAGVPTLRIMPGYLHARAFLDILRRIEILPPLSASFQRQEPASNRNKRASPVRSAKKPFFTQDSG